MPVPRSTQPAATQRSVSYTQATGPTYAGPIGGVIQTAQNPVIVPPVLVGIDALLVPALGHNLFTVSFHALVKRNTSVNPANVTINSANETLTVPDGSILIFTAFAQGRNAATVSCTPEAVDKNGVIYPGPFLGPGTYTNFRVIVDNPERIAVTIVGQIHYQQGSS